MLTGLPAFGCKHTWFRKFDGHANVSGDLASHEWWERRQEVVPAASPPDNLQQVLDDVFDVQQPRDTEGAGLQQAGPQSVQPLLHCPKTAPADSLLVRQACAVLCCVLIHQFEIW